MTNYRPIILWGLLGFFVPPAGILLFFLWCKKKNSRAKALLFGALLMILLCSISFGIQQITVPIFTKWNLI